jgi:CelD/BcsL family acetyltransferase involved in cellulose biosynthesis
LSTAESGYGFRTLYTVSEFAAIRDEWHSLFVRSACGTVSMTAASVHAVLAHMKNATITPCVVVAFRNEQLVGGILLMLHQAIGGLRISTFADHQSYGVDILAEQQDADTPAAMLAQLRTSFPSAFSLTLADIRADSNTNYAAESLRGYAAHRDERRRASYFEVPDSDEALRAALSSNFRKNLRKQEARLHEADNVTFRFVEAADSSNRHFELFTDLEASGWKGEAGTAIRSQPTLHSFYATFTEELARDGLLEWHFLEAGGRSIGAHLAVRIGASITLLKIAYDESHATLSPGNMLFLALVRREIESGASLIIDCLTDMPWHRNWKMQSRTHFTVTLYPRLPIPLVFGYAPTLLADALRANSRVRNLVRRFRNIRLNAASTEPAK